MKKAIKNIFMFTTVVGVVAVLGGCGSDHKDVDYARTHQNDDLTTVSARMHQKFGNKSRMGEIKFKETTAGLSMTVALNEVRPGQEYSLKVLKLKNCKKDKSAQMKCDKEDMDLNLPTFTGDKDGKINATYILKGITAAELNKTKIELVRDDKCVGGGMLKHHILF